MAKRVSSMSETEQLDRDLATCRCGLASRVSQQHQQDQLMIFIRTVFDDFSTKEELLTLLPLKTTTRGIDIYNAVKSFFVEKKVPLEKLVSVTTDGAPAMTGMQASCKAVTQPLEMITATLVSACDPTRRTAACFRGIPEAALHSAPLNKPA
ncbi:protein ZBED8-like isoform X2 [Thunnus maccoyii]|uniref:protein ZBED8-like isoform X2 n=1 Tax=Thunnus maccoyii TaxID=8240 RepID=UPI001C4B0D69|nr:protein ZBED8-like isoform X2 [Thunnus maccoyii]